MNLEYAREYAKETFEEYSTAIYNIVLVEIHVYEMTKKSENSYSKTG